jgi:hypothetical protein
MSKRSKYGWFASVGALALVAGGVALTAPSAHAGVQPTPTPTYTHTPPPQVNPLCRVGRDGKPVNVDEASLTAYHGNPTPTPSYTKTPKPTPTPTITVTPTPPPTPTPTVQCANWTFDLQLSDIDGINVNDVRGRGAIGFNRWIDVQLSNNVDKFRSVGGNNNVVLWHEGLNAADAQLSVDRYTCTVDIQQLNARFVILSGAGIGRGWRVFANTGRFNLEGQLSWDLVRNRCPLAFVSDGQILRALLSSSGGGLPAPATDDFSVQGRALLFRTVRPVIWSPTAPASA